MAELTAGNVASHFIFMAYQMIGEAVLRYIILSALLMYLPVLQAADQLTLAERQEIHEVDLRDVAAIPENYEGLRLKFRAVFVTRGKLFDNFHTRFKAAHYMNLVVWDDQARLWVPEVRAEPVIGLYYRKNREHVSIVKDLQKYEVIDVTGVVVSSYDSQPWIDVHQIDPVAGAGRYSDESVFLLQQAAKLAEDNAYDLAAQNYAAALETNLNTDERIEVLEAQAINLLNWGKYTDAIAVLDEAIAAHKSWDGDPLPTLISELYYLSAKGYSEAAAEVQQSEAQAEDAEAHAELAKEYFTKSIEHAKLAVRNKPEHGDAYAILGIGLSGLEQYDEARTHCQRAILMRPDNAEIRWYLGRILDRQGDYDEAIAVLNKAIDLSPKDYRIHKTIALVHLHKSEKGGKAAHEDRITALREFDIAIRLNSSDPDLYYYSGLVIEQAAQAGGEVRIGRKMVKASMQLASDRYRQCVKLDDAYLPAVLKLAEYYRGIEKHDEAVAFYKRALELAPEREEMYSKLGAYFSDLGRLADAYDVYLKYQERQPDALDTIYALGNLSLQLDEYQRAVDWLDELLKKERDHAMAHADLSDAHVELGNWREAESHADAALALLEDDAEKTRVRRKKGIALWEQDEPAEVLLALTGHTEGTKDIRVLLALGWSQTTSDKARADAMSTAKAALALDADHASARELLGWAQYLNGDYAAAEKTLSALDLGKELAGYRVGMAMFKQGPERYADARPLLDVARRLRDRREILDDARGDVSDALRAIRDYERDMERKQRAAEREAKKKAYEERKRKEAEARRKAAEEKKRKAAEAKKAN